MPVNPGMDREKITISEFEQNAFMRWLLTHHDCRDFSQYLSEDGWEVTALFVGDEFHETLYEQGETRAVSRALYNRFRRAQRGRAALKPAARLLVEDWELCLN